MTRNSNRKSFAFLTVAAVAALALGSVPAPSALAGDPTPGRIPIPGRTPVLPRMPDLTVGPYFRPIGGGRPAGIEVAASFHNVGLANAGAFRVAAYVYFRLPGRLEEVRTYSQSLAGLRSGTSQGVVFARPLTFPAGTTVTIRYVADPVPETGNDFAPRSRGSVSESNESNNSMTRTYTVR